jgi:hypothetical protein
MDSKQASGRGATPVPTPSELPLVTSELWREIELYLAFWAIARQPCRRARRPGPAD